MARVLSEFGFLRQGKNPLVVVRRREMARCLHAAFSGVSGNFSVREETEFIKPLLPM